MYLVVIAWIYVVLMMSVAEATNTTGTVLGALVTFVLYGLLPVALVVYLMGAPARSKAIKKRNAEETAQAAAAAGRVNSESGADAAAQTTASGQPDAGGHAASGAQVAAAADSMEPAGPVQTGR
ncbi:MAG: hypothetical protein JWP47_2780 [Polaromonas sp.]|jgi:Na+-transporting methylmalonyl-CoA/oxaloacetate decarboxylase gamma subunit|nr:hypothetical protein [Polaromonas sp.]